MYVYYSYSQPINVCIPRCLVIDSRECKSPSIPVYIVHMTCAITQLTQSLGIHNSPHTLADLFASQQKLKYVHVHLVIDKSYMYMYLNTTASIHATVCYCPHVQTVEEDVEGYVSVVEGLGREARRLVRADHFDSTNITARQVHVCAFYETNVWL